MDGKAVEKYKKLVKVEEFIEEVRMFQLAKVFDDKVRLFIVLAALCGETMDGKAVEKYKKHIERAIKFTKGATLNTKDVLWAFDAYVAAYPSAVKTFPLAVKAAYDEDWAEEKAILAYYEDESEEHSDEPGFANAKKALAPFLKWLKEAESSDEDDSDSD